MDGEGLASGRSRGCVRVEMHVPLRKRDRDPLGVQRLVDGRVETVHTLTAQLGKLDPAEHAKHERGIGHLGEPDARLGIVHDEFDALRGAQKDFAHLIDVGAVGHSYLGRSPLTSSKAHPIR